MHNEVKWMNVIFLTSEIKFKSFDFTRGPTVKTRTKTKTLPFKSKTMFLVVEVPRYQDQSIEDYSTDYKVS